MSIGKNIAHLRKEKGLTQAEFGDLLGVSNQAVSKWESEMTMPDVMLLPQIAKVLGVDLNDLYGMKKEIQEVFASVSESEIDMQDKRVLNITAKVDGVDIKMRMPCKVLKSVIDLCDFNDEDQKKTTTEFLGNMMLGTTINVDNEDCKAEICVEDYED